MRVVVKVGTSSVTHADGSLNADMFTSLAAQIARLCNDGHEVLLVTSGAVGLGCTALGHSERPTELEGLQAAAAVGQHPSRSRGKRTKPCRKSSRASGSDSMS